MWSPIWSLCWLFQFLPLTISPVLWLWDTLFHFYNALVVTIWQNFLDKLDHFEGRFEKENVSTKEDWPFTLKNHSRFSSSSYEKQSYFFMINFPSYFWFSCFSIFTFMRGGDKNASVRSWLQLNSVLYDAFWACQWHFKGANDRINPSKISIIFLLQQDFLAQTHCVHF